MSDPEAQFRALIEESRRPKVRGPRRGQALFSKVFVPVLLLALIGSLSAGAFFSGLSNTPRTAHLMTLALLVAIVVIWTAEQLYPSHVDWNYRLLTDGARGWNRFARDMFYAVYVTWLSALLIAWTASQVGVRMVALGIHLWPSRGPLALRVALAFFLVELFSYGFHRAAHHHRLLWQFHSTHHVVTELGGLKALRTHPIDNVLFYFVRTVPLMLVGAGAEELVAATYLGSVLSILAHANINVHAGVLDLIVNYPNYHAVHHSSDLVEGNSNFGCHTVLWDRVFGTFRSQTMNAPEIGVQPVGKRSLWQELFWPFYRSVKLESAQSKQ